MQYGFLLRVACLLSVLTCGCTSEREIAQQALPPSMPATVDNWNNDIISHVEFERKFQLSDYKTIFVPSVDTSAVELPPKSADTYEPVTTILGQSANIFTDALRDQLHGIIKVDSSNAVEKIGERALLLRLRVTKADPGSFALRFWAVPGASPVNMNISGDVVDAGTGELLLRFSDNIYGSGHNLFDMGYASLLSEDFETSGHDVGILLEAFSPP